MEQQGWIKLHRNLLNHKSFWLNKDKLAIWLYLQLKATHGESIGYFEGKEIILKSGQLLVSYQEIADFLNIDKGKVKRAIQSLRDDTRIDTRTDRQKSLITLIDWDFLQNRNDTRNDTAFDTRMTHERHTVKETENEKEKRSKREKDKEKEKNKNEKNERISIYSRQQSADSCQQRDEFSFPLEKHGQGTGACPQDLDRWLEEDDGIDDWDKVQIYYRNLNSRQQLAASSQQDSYTEDNEADSFALANPIQQEKKERSNPQPPIPLLPCEANHTEGVHGITQEACMESTQGVVWNQPPRLYNCEANHGDTPPSPVTDMFEEFWQAYPKKVGKGYAQECFKKIKPSRKLLDTMLEAIAKQKKSDMWKRDKGQYIPNPSTWLNQKRWEDDLGGETEENPWSSFKLGIEL